MPELPWIATTPDRLLITESNEVIPLEIKCPETCIGKKIQNLDYLVIDKFGKHQISGDKKGRGPGMMFQVRVSSLLNQCCRADRTQIFAKKFDQIVF